MCSATGSCSSHMTLTCSDAIHEGLKSNFDCPKRRVGQDPMAKRKINCHRTADIEPSSLSVHTLSVGSHQVWPVTHRLTRTLASSRETPMPSACLIGVANFGSAAPSKRFAVWSQ